MKVQIRTIDLEKIMHEHILSPREVSNMVNVVILLAFKALLVLENPEFSSCSILAVCKNILSTF